MDYGGCRVARTVRPAPTRDAYPRRTSRRSHHVRPVKLRSDRTAPRLARSVGGRADPEPASRSPFPHDRHDRRGAGDGRTDASTPRRQRDGGCRSRRCHPRDDRGRRSGRGHRLRDLGARGARGRRDRPRGGAGRGSPGCGCRRGPGVRAVPGSASARPGHRRLARWRDCSHERRPRGSPRRRAPDCRHHGERSLAGRDAGRPRGRDRRARPGLVPHGRLPEPDPGRCGRRSTALGPRARS